MKRMTVRAARKRMQLTQVVLAKRAGIEQSTVSKLERGQVRQPSFAIIAAIAEALCIDPRALDFSTPDRTAA